ncbi:MAG: hypothetical protein OXI63_26100 [Candidatus Poribacteria bacterium]|nr:hypothetical protein [Candidatus Poribacteria bacterium]
MTKQTTAQESKQQAFDQATRAYLSTNTQENVYREQNALRLDTNNNDSFTPDSRFEFATPNWNDTLTDVEMFRPCGEVSETLKRMPDTLHPSEVIHDIRDLLNASFSERIKVHIVMLVADTETVEGACRHCFDLYGEDSRSLDNMMTIWRTLTHVLDTASVFNAFLERAWHLNPTSPYFPERYRDIADTVQEAQFDNRLRQRAPYSNPYNQLELLNETLKKLAYHFKHCDDPNQLCKLANSQVRVAGAMHVINEKLERKHQSAIRHAEQLALNPPTETD